MLTVVDLFVYVVLADYLYNDDEYDGHVRAVCQNNNLHSCSLVLELLFLYIFGLVGVDAEVARCYDCRINYSRIGYSFVEELNDTNKLFAYFVLSHLFVVVINYFVMLFNKFYC